MSGCRSDRRERAQGGQALIEFGLISLAMYLILAATIDFGRAMFIAQAIQDAARVLARELSVAELPAESTFADALADPAVRADVFDVSRLAVDAGPCPSGLDLSALPLVNRMLVPVMLSDCIEGRQIYHYPGALLRDTVTNEFVVVIPRVASPGGVETVTWLPVVEELGATFPAAGGGIVSLAFNYPFQGALLSGFQADPLDPYAANLGSPIAADDSSVAPPAGGEPVTARTVGPYAGPYGLGAHLALGPLAGGRPIRPFRKLLSAQSVFRREVLE